MRRPRNRSVSNRTILLEFSIPFYRNEVLPFLSTCHEAVIFGILLAVVSGLKDYLVGHPIYDSGYIQPVKRRTPSFFVGDVVHSSNPEITSSMLNSSAETSKPRLISWPPTETWMPSTAVV
jgi:hypothetical protein